MSGRDLRVSAQAVLGLRERHGLTIERAAALAHVEPWRWQAAERGDLALPLDRYEIVVWRTGDHLLT